MVYRGMANEGFTQKSGPRVPERRTARNESVRLFYFLMTSKANREYLVDHAYGIV